MGKGILIVVIGAILTLNVMTLNNNNRLTKATEVAEESFSKSKAKSICNAAAEMLLAKLGDDNTYRETITTPINWLDGEISYRVVDTNISGEDFAKIDVKAKYFNSVKTAKIVVQLMSGGFVPIPVKAALTTRSDIATLGSYLIDGRNHDLLKNVIPNEGKYGIWTTATYFQGNHPVGGTDEFQVDYIPTEPGNPLVIKTGQSLLGGFPTTPDEVIGGISKGYYEGYLKELAKSGAGGSQYATKLNELSFPLQNITYVEGDITPVKLSGSGLLIVHNSSTSALIGNTSGTFTGLVIVDDINKFKSVLLGAIISLSPSPSDSKLMGNGDGVIYYCEEAIIQATSSLQNSNFGFGKHRVIVKSWLE